MNSAAAPAAYGYDQYYQQGQGQQGPPSGQPAPAQGQGGQQGQPQGQQGQGQVRLVDECRHCTPCARSVSMCAVSVRACVVCLTLHTHGSRAFRPITPFRIPDCMLLLVFFMSRTPVNPFVCMCIAGPMRACCFRSSSICACACACACAFALLWQLCARVNRPIVMVIASMGHSSNLLCFFIRSHPISRPCVPHDFCVYLA